MPDKNSPDNRQLDERLAQFTDQLLGGKAELDTENAELRQLEDTVVHMKLARDQNPLDPNMALRIHNRLVAEWRKLGLGIQNSRKEPLESKKDLRSWLGWFFAGSRPRSLALSFLTVSITLLAAVIMLSPNVSNTLSAAVQGGASLIPILIALIACAGLGIIYFIWKKK